MPREAVLAAMQVNAKAKAVAMDHVRVVDLVVGADVDAVTKNYP
jgi:hypothetical protein